MAKCKIEVTETIVLTLDKNEADYLKDMLQNAGEDAELKKDNKARCAIYHALPHSSQPTEFTEPTEPNT